MAVVVETTVGDFTVDLYTKERPQTCRNFLKLCKIKYYNWNLFFTVQSNFIAQTGDPTGTGKVGESVYGIVLGEKARYYEAEQMPKIKHHKAGLLSMVNCGDNMLGSQFFITLASDLQSLDGEHCVFGEITEGIEIILKFNESICDGDHRPYQDIRISHTIILEDPFDDPKGLEIPDRSPEPTKEVLTSDRIGADEAIDDTAGMTTEQIAEMHKEKEAKARATILEIVGDIPDAEMAPPENVLFVCKLNPVTNDDDLEIIFSRFGKIIGCEVIRERQSGDSLQYAFIEFAERKSCEEAYFKMDNVLIDDRRIHVDFSQSVSKMRWRGKGKGLIRYPEEEGKEEKANDGKKEKSEKGGRTGRGGDERASRASKNETRRRSRSESPRKERTRREDTRDSNRQSDRDSKNESKKDSRRKQQESSSKNGDDKDKRSKKKERSRSREKLKERRERSRSRSHDKNRDRRERSRSKEKTRERREKSTERNRERKGRSRERSRDRRDKKDRSNRSRSRENNHRDSRTKEEKRKKKQHDRRESSEERGDGKKRRKSPDRSEEKHKRKHKHKSQR